MKMLNQQLEAHLQFYQHCTNVYHAVLLLLPNTQAALFSCSVLSWPCLPSRQMHTVLDPKLALLSAMKETNQYIR
jgi:hypothetical protein